MNHSNKTENQEETNYTIYVFVRKDIPLEQQLVQLGHAAAEVGRSFYAEGHGTASLIALSVPDEQALLTAQRMLRPSKLRTVLFHEPDFGIGNAALGVEPVEPQKRELFRNWSLWRPDMSDLASSLAQRGCAEIGERFLQRQQIALVKQARKTDGSFEMLLLYNLVRGVALDRGFHPRKGSDVGGRHRFVLGLMQLERKTRELDMRLTPSQLRQVQDARVRASVQNFEEVLTTRGPQLARPSLARAMRLTPHGLTSNVEVHGSAAWWHYGQIYRALRRGEFDTQWPQWLKTHGSQLLSRQLCAPSMHDLLAYHDCGKPFVMLRDDEGALHFPEHARRSAQVWRSVGGTEQEAQMMELLSVLHTGKSEEVGALANHAFMPSLLLAAYAHWCAEAKSSYGGLDSERARRKLKGLNLRAELLLSRGLSNTEQADDR